MKKKEIIKIGENRQLTTYAKNFLKSLRDSWGAKKVKREIVLKCDESGDPIWGEEEVLLQSRNKELNKGVEREEFYRFAEMIKTEEEYGNILKIVESGDFEVMKAIQAFEAAPKIVMDRSVVIRSFEDSDKLNSPFISTLVKYKGKEKAGDLLFVMVMNFAKKFGKRNDLSEGDVLELCADIVEDFRGVNLGDIKMIFRNALFVSGKRFNLDYASVFELLKECKEERMSYAVDKQLEEHRQMTGQEKRVRFGESKPILSGKGLSMGEMKKEIELMERNKKEKR